MVLAPDAVVMEMGESSASAAGAVTMETSGSAERAEPDRIGVPAVRNRNYRVLIVIGEIPTDFHLEAARSQITGGETKKNRTASL